MITLERVKEGQYPGATFAAKNIRKILRVTFPGVKFSVRTSNNSAVRVGWEGTPTRASVYTILSVFEKGHFDGMNDLYSYNTTPFHEVYGGVKYLFMDKSLDEDDVLNVIHGDDTLTFYGSKLDDVGDIVRKYCDGSLWRFCPDTERELRLAISDAEAVVSPEARQARAELEVVSATLMEEHEEGVEEEIEKAFSEVACVADVEVKGTKTHVRVRRVEL